MYDYFKYQVGNSDVYLTQ